MTTLELVTKIADTQEITKVVINLLDDKTPMDAISYLCYEHPLKTDWKIDTQSVGVNGTLLIYDTEFTKKAERTKGQWVLGSKWKADEYACNIIGGEHNRLIAQTIQGTYFSVEEAEANAAFICKAVNNYDMLLSALKEVVARFPVGQYNVKKDFEKLVALAAASKAIHTAEEEK